MEGGIKAKVKNVSRGERGIHIGGELLFIKPGATQTFDNVSKGDLREALKVKDFHIRSSEDGGKTWEDHAEAETPPEVPFLAIASGSGGENMRRVELAPGEWFIGTALASEQPADGGYDWQKIGGKRVTVAVADEAPVPDTPKGDGGFDPEALIAKNAPDVIAALPGLTAEQLDALKAAEIDREKPRKGVLEAIEAAGKPAADPFA